MSLHDAVRCQDVDAVYDLLAHPSVDVNAVDQRAKTALHLAAACGNEDIARALLQNGANVDAIDADKCTAFYCAAASGSIEVVRLLLNEGANMDLLNCYGQSGSNAAIDSGNLELVRLLVQRVAMASPAAYASEKIIRALHHGVYVGNVEVVRLLLDKGVDVEATQSGQATALQFASDRGHVDTVRLLIERGADVAARDEFYGQTSLHAAATHGQVDIMRLLLEHGADIEAKDKHGHTALYSAAGKGHTPALQLLLDHGADVKGKIGSEALRVTATIDDEMPLDSVRLLLQRGATTEATDENGWTALHYGAEHGIIDLVQLLVENGADMNPIDANGKTPMHIAADHGDADVVGLLLEHGADVELQDKMAHTALDRAAKGGCEAVVRLILEKGSALGRKKMTGGSAIHLAAVRGSAATVRLLLEKAAVLDMDAEAFSSALIVGAQRGKTEIVRALIEHGIDLEATDTDGRSALHHAASKGYVDIVSHVVENGARMDTLDRDRRTPLATAIHVGTMREPFAHARYLIIRALCERGAKWDASCGRDAKADSAWKSKLAHAFTISDEKRALRQLRLGLRACAVHWIHQRSQDQSANLTDIEEEAYFQGDGAVKTYLAALAKTPLEQIIRRRKLCVVGPSCSGKTSLIKSLAAMKSVMVDHDDRTIGIDLFPLQFADRDLQPATRTRQVGKYEASVWDFAGQDIYQVAHSLYFSKRTLYLVFVNLQLYAAELASCLSSAVVKTGEADMSRWVQDTVFKWVRLVLARQPDAELVVVCSKSDSVSVETADEVVADLETRLDAWATEFVAGKDGVFQAAVDKSVGELRERSRVRVSVATQTDVERAWGDLQRVVAERRARAFVMPLAYTQVLQAIHALRAAADRTVDPVERVAKLLVPCDELVARLVDNIDGLKTSECRHILATLHALGDVLWYAQEHRLATAGIDTVILDPRLMLELVREVVNHNHGIDGADTDAGTSALRKRGELKHSLLVTFALWGALCRQSRGQALVLYFKQLLQRFNLAYPVGNQPMAWDFDLMVPAYWKSKQPSSSQVEDGDDGRNMAADTFTHRVSWQYTVPAEVSETVFDQFVVQSYSGDHERDVSASDVVMAKCGQCEARIRYEAGKKQSEDVVVIHVAATSSDECWATLRQLVLAMELVLAGYPGLGCVRRHLLQKKANGRYNTYDLQRVVAAAASESGSSSSGGGGGGRVTASAFATIQERFCKPTGA